MILNKIIKLIFVIVLLISVDVFGQRSKFELGLEGGVSLNSLSSIINTSNNFQKQFEGSIMLEYHLSKFISIRTNIGFSRFRVKSFLTTFDFLGMQTGTITNFHDWNYLKSPILVRFSLGGKLKYFVNAGSYFAYLLKYNDKFTYSNGDPEVNYNNTSNFKRADIGISTGFGLKFPIHKKIFTSIEFRRDFGLSNINTDKNATFNPNSIHTNSINLLLGIVYQFKTKELKN